MHDARAGPLARSLQRGARGMRSGAVSTSAEQPAAPPEPQPMFAKFSTSRKTDRARGAGPGWRCRCATALQFHTFTPGCLERPDRAAWRCPRAADPSLTERSRSTFPLVVVGWREGMRGRCVLFVTSCRTAQNQATWRCSGWSVGKMCGHCGPTWSGTKKADVGACAHCCFAREVVGMRGCGGKSVAENYVVRGAVPHTQGFLTEQPSLAPPRALH